MTLTDLNLKFEEIKSSVSKVVFTDVELPDLFKSEYERYLASNRANGYSQVEWARYSSRITTANGKFIFLTNFWFCVAAELANYLDCLSQHQQIFFSIYKESDREAIAKLLREIPNDGRIRDKKNEQIDNIKAYFMSNSMDEHDLSSFLAFVTDYKSWGGGKTIDRKDYYVSPLLQAGNLLAETQSAVAEIAKQLHERPELKKCLVPVFINNHEKVDEPLVSSKNRGEFVYKLIAYLVDKKIYQPLFACLVEKNIELGSVNMELGAWRLTSIFKVSDHKITRESLEIANRLRYFEEPFEIESRYYYLSNQWTDGTESRLDIQTLKAIFHQLYDQYHIDENIGTYSLLPKFQNFSPVGMPLPKPFLLLAGISGTGKTRFVREQARRAWEQAGRGVWDMQNYCLVSVRPDWHEPSDLIGYVSRIDGVRYVVTPLLKFIVKAWMDACDDDGELKDTSQMVPYWLCLDEMNLAPVEQYFADYLSVIETRSWNDGVYACDPLLKADVLNSHDGNYRDELLAQLGFEEKDDNWPALAEKFLAEGISLPPNLIVAGTVNMDETTHGFSRKVVDRALTLDFSEFFPNDFDSFFAPKTDPVLFGFSLHSHASQSALAEVAADNDGQKSLAFLEKINSCLKATAFQLAYRALNELLLALISHKPDNHVRLMAVWDDFLMQKVLPRIEGDSNKLLASVEGERKNVLELLRDVLEATFAGCEQRQDFYRTSSQSGDEQPVMIEWRSLRKIDWMLKRLKNNHYTDYWA